jgi:HEAT repeat protein
MMKRVATRALVLATICLAAVRGLGGEAEVAEEARALLRQYEGGRGEPAATVGKLVGLGKAALPVLREVIRQGPLEWPARSVPGAAQVHERNRKAIFESMVAALALGRIGDPESIGLLLEKLERAGHPEQVAAFCDALGRMRVAEGLEPVFRRLAAVGGSVHARRRTPYDSHDYFPLREAMVAFGDAAREFLRKQLAVDQPLASRAVATGVLFEIERPDEAAAFYRAWGGHGLAEAALVAPGTLAGKPRPDLEAIGRQGFWRPASHRFAPPRVAVPPALLVEAGYVLARLQELAPLARLKEEALGLDVAAAGLVRADDRRWLNKREGRAVRELARALAERGDERAIKVYAQLMERSMPAFTATLLEALVILGSPKGAPVLEEMARRAEEWDKRWNPRERLAYQGIGRVALAAIPALKGQNAPLVGLLKDEWATVPELAARVLARRGELRALPVLVEAASTLREDDHRSVRDAILALGEAGMLRLDELRKAVPDWGQRLVCEACALRIERPELAAAFDRAAEGPHPVFGIYSSHAPPDLGAFRIGGQRLAQAVGLDALPLLEAALAFRADEVSPHMAAFALAHFGRERSIPALVAAFPETRRLRSGHPILIALEAFGEKGAKAARKLTNP